MNKGFSLVELIVVIAIMAILVGVAVPTYTAYIDRANTQMDEQLAGEIDHAIEVLLIDPDVKSAGITTVTVEASGDGLAYTVKDGDNVTAFKTALEGLMPIAKSSFKKATKIVFTINGLSCDYEITNPS